MYRKLAYGKLILMIMILITNSDIGGHKNFNWPMLTIALIKS